MITIRSLLTRILEHSKRPKRHRRGGFTLVETIVSTGVVTIVSGGMMSSVLFLSKTGMSLGNHLNMASEARITLSYIANDLMSTVGIDVSNKRRMRVLVEDPDEMRYWVDYQTKYDNNEQSYYLRRRVKDNISGSRWSSWETIIARDLLKDLEFHYYDSEDKVVNQNKIDDVKKVNLLLELETELAPNDLTQSDTIYSARFVLRNRATPPVQ